ncbi:hypothetical protein EGW08_019842, partial [Elysia chlorotica]
RIVRNKANDRSKSSSPHGPDGSPPCTAGDASNPSSEGGPRTVSGGPVTASGGFNISSIMSPSGNNSSSNNNNNNNSNNNNNNSSTNGSHKRKVDADTGSNGIRDASQDMAENRIRWYDRTPPKAPRADMGGSNPLELTPGQEDPSPASYLGLAGSYHQASMAFSSGGDIKQEFHVSPPRAGGEQGGGGGPVYPMAPPISYGGNPSAYEQGSVNTSVPLAVLPQVYNAQV